jgi:signal transduction histidine kinase
VPRRWWTGVPRDLATTAAVTAILVVAVVESGDQPGRPLDGWSVAALALVGAWSGLARHAPRTALVGAAVTMYATLAMGVPAFSPALGLGVPLLCAALAGHLWWGVAVLAGVALSGTGYRFLEGSEPVTQIVVTTLLDFSLMAVLLLLGEAIHSRRAVREEAALRLRLADQEHRQRLTSERVRTARDLHDVLSHTLALVGIQANVAAEKVDTEPERAKRALENVRVATREAVSDLRSTIAVLREETPDRDPHAPAPGLAQLPELVESVRAAGLAATFTRRGGPVPLRPAVELAAYRVVQESLTNSLRHSGARSVAVLVEQSRGGVRVEVSDDGHGGRTGPLGDGQGDRTGPLGDGHPTGSGLRGMADRVGALGGTVTAGPAGGGGFAVRAHIPATGGAA